MASIIKPILAEVCTVGLADRLIHLIEKCAECETVRGIVGIAGVASAAPLLVPAAILIGMELFKAKGEREEEEKFQTHCKQVIALLRGLDGRVDDVAGQLDDLIQHRTWVWARFSGGDQAAFAKRVRGEVKKDLTALGIDIRDEIRDGVEGLRIYSEEIIATQGEHTVALVEIRDTQLRQATHDDVASLREEMRLIRETLANKPAQGPADQPPAIAQPVADAARAVQQNPEASLLERTEAAIVSRSPAALDQLAQLDALVETADYKRHQLRGDYHYFRGEFDKAIEPFEQAMALRPKDFTARNNAALTHTFARLGDIAAHQKRAIDIFQGTLKLVPPNSADWAMTQNNLGTAWQDLPTGDRAKNLENAIACYTRALEVHTQADFPADWAGTQNNLGIACRSLPTGDRAKNLENAIACYTQALEVYTLADFPAEWAMTQNNLGVTWGDLLVGDRTQNLENAIACFTRALEVRTQADFPAEWARTQNNLGNAWSELPTGDRAKNLENAIACYTRALKVHTLADFPAEWATTQNNLGTTWSEFPIGNPAKNLENAIACFTRALAVRTQADFPADWATTQYNLAFALADLADQPNLPAGQDRCGMLRRAIACSKGALMVYTPEAFPHVHANTMKSLSIDRRAYEAGGCAEKVPFDDIPPAE